MGHRRLMAGGAVVSGVLMAAVVQISRAPSSSAANQVHVQEHVTSATYVPVGSLVSSAAPANQGDYITFDDPLTVVPGNAAAGRVMGTCWLEDVAKNLFYCTTDFLLPDGQITADGVFDATGTPTTAPITGGTGAYRSARGEVQITAQSATLNDFVFRLDR